MIFAVMLMIVTIIVIYAIWHKNKRVSALKEAYQLALKGGDKELALDAGRRYYTFMRGSENITALDELDLMKAIDGMK